MKNCLSYIASVLLLIAAPLFAQKPVVELPELQEWYSVSGTGSGVSYLPGFSSDGGMNAIAVAAPNSPTWYNRFAYDTVNQFSWSPNYGSEVVNQADFNGDGIIDYMDLYGNVYKGVEKNHPPERIPVTQYKFELLSSFRKVLDVNQDGNDDIIIKIKSNAQDNTDICVIIFGNKDITKMQMIPLASKDFRWDVLVGAYMNQDGKARIVSYRNDNTRWEGFILQSVDVKGGQTGGDIKIVLNIMDSFGSYLSPNEQPKYEQIYPFIYQNRKNKSSISLGIIPNGSGTTQFYSIENDKFISKRTIKNVLFEPLNQSIDNDSTDDWIASGNLIQQKGFYVVYSDNPSEKDSLPKMKFPMNCSDGRIAKAIGDVTGDGIGDLAESSNGCFTIFQGIDWRKLSADGEAGKLDFLLHTTEPNPVNNDGKFVLPISIERNGNYMVSLYGIDGRYISALFNGELPKGEIRLPFDVKGLNISAGMYLIRLSDGKHTREHAIMVSR